MVILYHAATIGLISANNVKKAMSLKITTPYAFSEIGRKAKQEDTIAPHINSLNAHTHCFVLCDGVGGNEMGDIASQTMATETEKECRKLTDSDKGYSREQISIAIETAWKKLDTYKDKTSQTHPMATTLAMVLIDDKSEKAYIAHVGDSRVFLIRPSENRIAFVTTDHSLVAELIAMGRLTKETASSHPKAKTITKAIIPGVRYDVDIDEVSLEAGDYLFICSDGMLESLTNEDLLRILSTPKNDEEKMKEIHLNAMGKTYDNYSAILIPVETRRGVCFWSKLKKLLCVTLFMLTFPLWGTAQNNIAQMRKLLMDASTLEKDGKLTEAVAKYEAFCSIAPQNAFGYLKLGDLYYKGNGIQNAQRALQYYRKYIELGSKIAKESQRIESVKKTIAKIEESLAETEPEHKVQRPLPSSTVANVQNQVVDSTTVNEEKQPENRENSTSPSKEDETPDMEEMFDSSDSDENEASELLAAFGVARTETPTESDKTSTDNTMEALAAFGLSDSNNAQPEKPSNETIDISLKIDPQKDFLKYFEPYNILKSDLEKLPSKAVQTSEVQYVSSLFSHETGRDAFVIKLDDKGIPTLDASSGVEIAYRELLGKNYNLAESNHGLSKTTKIGGNEWQLNFEYSMPDTMCAKNKCMDITKKMIGNFLHKFPAESPEAGALVKYEINQIDAHKGTFKISYHFKLKPINGVLYGTGSFNVAKSIGNQDYLLVSFSSDKQIFAPEPMTYKVESISLDRKKEEIDYSLYKDYFEFCKVHGDLQEKDIKSKLRSLSNLYHPEAIYTLYVGIQCGLWKQRKSPEIMKDLKKRMIQLHENLLNR